MDTSRGNRRGSMPSPIICRRSVGGRSPQRIHPRALEFHGYAKARRIGYMAMIGGKDKTRIREATPIPFRDLLIGIAEGVRAEKIAA